MSATYKDTRGSIILAALIVTLITGGLVGLFLKTVTQEVENSYRARMGFQAVNLAEAGLEYAIYAMIADDWNGWGTKNGKGGYYKDTFPTLNNKVLFNNIQVQDVDIRTARVYVQPTWKKNGEVVPVAVSEGAIQLKNGLIVRRQIRIEMTKGSSTPWKRGWGNGILGRDDVTFNGNKIWVDSYRSSDAIFVVGYPQGYDPLNPNDNGSVASLSVDNGDLDIGNADVYGRIATAGGLPDVGKQGSIFGEGDAEGTINSDRIALDFYAEIPDPVAPTLSSPETSLSGFIIGTSGATTEYELVDFSVPSTDVYVVEGEVVMVITGDIDIKGEVQIAENSSLEIYVAGDATIGGNGVVNKTNIPENFMLFGTGTGTTIKLHGNGALIGAVYAPNSDIELKGSGSTGVMYGAAVGDDIEFVGNYEFHYDEDLANLEDEDDETGSYVPVVNEWSELTDSGVRIDDWDTLRKNGFSDIN